LCDQQRPLAPFIGKKVVAQTEGNLSDASQEKKNHRVSSFRLKKETADT
jgi:hypothetical protein